MLLGGISSYCLVVLIVAFLRKDGLLYVNEGRLLLDFLFFYGKSFDPKKTGISQDP